MGLLYLILRYILVQHVSAALCGLHQVVLQTDKKVFFLGKGLPNTNSEYRILVIWLLFQIVE